MKRGTRTPEAEKARRKMHRKKQRFMELREELQNAGVIPTEPGGAVRDERVDPATQGEQSLPALTGQAIRNGWAVPEGKKPQLVDELIGILENPEESNKVKVAAFNALRQADQHQHERDNPDKSQQQQTPVTVVNNNQVMIGNVFDDIERDTRLILGTTAGDVPQDGDAEPVDEAEPDSTEEE